MVGFVVVVLLATGATTFEATVAGAKCESRVVGRDSQMECVYRVGDDLQFTIAGVGQELASISFEKSSDQGRYFAKFGMMHQCVLVSPGAANKESILEAGLAFVSPRSGRVFRSWEECEGR